MSALSLQLLGRQSSPLSNVRRARMLKTAHLLIAEYGTPTLGNVRDPVREIFYIVLSAKTTERLYQRRTNRS